MYFRGETSLELKVRIALNALAIRHEAQWSSGPYVVDFYLEDLGIALEADGDYWHDLPSAQEREARRDAYLQKQGLTTVRVRQSEVESTDDLSALLAEKIGAAVVLEPKLQSPRSKQLVLFS